MQKGKRNDKVEEKENTQGKGNDERRPSLKRKPSKAGLSQGGKGMHGAGRNDGTSMPRP